MVGEDHGRSVRQRREDLNRITLHRTCDGAGEASRAVELRSAKSMSAGRRPRGSGPAGGRTGARRESPASGTDARFTTTRGRAASRNSLDMAIAWRDPPSTASEGTSDDSRRMTSARVLDRPSTVSPSRPAPRARGDWEGRSPETIKPHFATGCHASASVSTVGGSCIAGRPSTSQDRQSLRTCTGRRRRATPRSTRRRDPDRRTPAWSGSSPSSRRSSRGASRALSGSRFSRPRASRRAVRRTSARSCTSFPRPAPKSWR